MRFLQLTDTRRLLMERLILAMVLPMVAGVVNAVGFLEVGFYTSHMTGNTTRVGDELAQGNATAAMWAAGIVGVFFVGGVVATLLVEQSRQKARARFFWPLATEALALLAFCVFQHMEAWIDQTFWLTATLCFAMGLQNAMVTQISDAVVRTTHLTGLLTDAGVEVARLLLWSIRHLRQRGFAGYSQGILQHHEMRKLELHGSVLCSFLFGAYLGPELFAHYGEWSMAVPGATLIGLIIIDWLLGIRGKVVRPA